MYKQKGFTLVEGLLIVLILSIVGFAGYFVWNNSKDKDNNNNTESTSSSENQQTETAEKESTEQEAQKPAALVNATQKDFSALGTSLSIQVPAGWETESSFAYPGEDSNEYTVNVFNTEKDIQLHLQIMDVQDDFYNQSVLQSFLGINNDTYFLTGALDTSDSPRYEQVGISSCDNGHCPTKINDTYSLNANITPVYSAENPSTTFNGSDSNLEEVKSIFASITIN